MEFQNYYRESNVPTMCVVQPWKFINIQNVKDGILELLLEIECPNNLFMVLQSWKFISIQNIKDGTQNYYREVNIPTVCVWLSNTGNS